MSQTEVGLNRCCNANYLRLEHMVLPPWIYTRETGVSFLGSVGTRTDWTECPDGAS